MLRLVDYLWYDMTWYLFVGYLIIGNELLYGLDGQIRHKLAFLNATLTKDCKITFIGHSIGCQIIMELMKELSYEDVICDKTKPVSQTISALNINKAQINALANDAFQVLVKSFTQS